MCTVVFLRRPDHRWPLLLAANRDEMADRPWQKPGRYWPDRPEVTAGRDQLAGGSWLGVNDTGVAAGILNRKDSLGPDPALRSRGELVLEALDHADAIQAAEALAELDPHSYRSFNLFVADNREKLVLKPASSYGGHHVWLGIETEQERWEEIIATHADTADFIVQEYVPVPEEMFPTIEDGHVQMRLKRFNINPFGIGGRYAGSITRISDRAVINVSAGGGLLPSVIGRHKRRLLAEDEDESEVLDGQKP